MYDACKNKSIECFNLWNAVGRPEVGDIHIQMKQAKLEYKNMLNECKENSDNIFGEDLYNSMMSKDMNRFWKSWRSKFGRKNMPAKSVDGCNGNEDIALAFRNFFNLTCIPNNGDIHEGHRQAFLSDFANYSVFEDHKNLFTVEDVESAILKLKKGKSAGMDKITTEYLIYAHPCLIVSLKLLFNLMLSLYTVLCLMSLARVF